MKIERHRLMAFIRILVVIFTAITIISLCIGESPIIKFDKDNMVKTPIGVPMAKEMLVVFLFCGIAFLYSIANLPLIGRLDARILYYFSWVLDLFFISALIYYVNSKDLHMPFIFLFFYLLFSYGVGRSLPQNMACATLISVVYIALGLYGNHGVREVGLPSNLLFSVPMFYVFGLLVPVFSPKEERTEQPPGEAQKAESSDTGGVKESGEAISSFQHIPKTLDEANRLLRQVFDPDPRIGEIAKLKNMLQNERQKFNTIRKIAHDIATQKELSTLYEDIVATIRKEISSQSGFLMMVERGRLMVKCDEGSIGDLTMKVLESAGILYEVLKSGRPMRLGSEDQEVLSSALAGTHYRVKSLLCVPLKTQYDANPFGIMGLVNYLLDDSFTGTDEEFLLLIAIEVAVAIKNIEYIKDIEKKYDELILGLAKAIEAKDDYTHDHVDRVRELSERLAMSMGLVEEQVRIVKTAATLHDVGKIATPDHILKKKGALDPDERKEIEKHAVKSAAILQGISSLEREVLDLVLHHHEKYDGTGYPEGLKGDMIPIGAKIIAVADTFDAMTSDRPYRKGFPEDVALQMMKDQCWGTQFDPEVLEAFLKMMSKRAISKKVRERRKRDSGEEEHYQQAEGKAQPQERIQVREQQKEPQPQHERIPAKERERTGEPLAEKPPEPQKKILQIDYSKKEQMH